jgi:hypothetical protein
MKLLEPLFKALASPDTLNAIPEGAANRLALASFKLSSKGEKLDFQDFVHDGNPDARLAECRVELLGLAEMALTCANKFRDAAKEKAELGNVTMARPVTVSRALALKPAGQTS